MKPFKNIGFYITVFFVLFITFGMVNVTTVFFNNFTGNSPSDLVRDVLQKAFSAKQNIEQFEFTDGLKNFTINFYGAVQRVIGCDYVPDVLYNEDVMRLDNGSLASHTNKISDDDLDYIDTALRNFKSFLDSENISLLYVQAPGKICDENRQLPAGAEDFSNENADAVISSAQSYGINTLDLRQLIKEQGLDYSSLFFNTDHHWKPSTSLWAVNEIDKKLENDYGFTTNRTFATAPENFSVETLPSVFLGSIGKRVGIYYGGVDDFDIYTPNFKTSLSYQIIDERRDSLKRSGSFEECFIFRDWLKGDLFDTFPYSTYSDGDFALTISKNNNIDSKTILLLRDSFSCTAAPFLALSSCHELHAIDARLYKKSITGYIKTLSPDVVIIMYNPSIIKEITCRKIFNINT